jgi:hypothetical protein
MTPTAGFKSGIYRQRGFWLRYFLEQTLVFGLLSLSICSAHAQIEVPSPYHLAHLRGIFVDAKGNPIPDAAVTLDRDDKTLYSTRTDRSGKFEIKHVSGRYRLHINMKGYSTVSRDVIVGLEALTYLHGSTLYIIAGPGACTDDCSSVFTSENRFDQAIRKNTRHDY